jgi:hypothetical protein
MARTRSRSGGRGALRTAVLAVAVLVALGSTAAVVLADDPQVLRLAVVGALWAFVLAAFAAPRRREEEEAAAPEPGPGSEVELRRKYEAELQREVAARREYELQLEVYLRRELAQGLTEEVAALREEVGRMRGELIDRLDGELRMERIETTRLIGGSLRALQDGARQLGIRLPELPVVLDDHSYGADPGAGSGRYGFDAGGSAEPPPPYRVSAPDPAPYRVPAPDLPPYRASGSDLPPYRVSAAEPPPYRASAPDPAAARSTPDPGSGPALRAPGPGRRVAAHPGFDLAPPAPRVPAAGESVPRPAAAARPPDAASARRRRAREDGEDNEVLSRLLGR